MRLLRNKCRPGSYTAAGTLYQSVCRRDFGGVSLTIVWGSMSDAYIERASLQGGLEGMSLFRRDSPHRQAERFRRGEWESRGRTGVGRRDRINGSGGGWPGERIAATGLWRSLLCRRGTWEGSVEKTITLQYLSKNITLTKVNVIGCCNRG